MRAILLLLLLVPSLAEAQVDLTGFETEAGISLKATNLFSDLPPFGFDPDNRPALRSGQ